MKQEIIDKLHTAYPHVFARKVHLWIGDGWKFLVNELCSVLENHISSLPEELQDQIYATQIKEKFGGLRFYMSHETPFITGAITLTERLSSFTCEECGKPGTVQNFGGRLQCLCDEDAALKRNQRK